jgi:integrase
VAGRTLKRRTRARLESLIATHLEGTVLGGRYLVKVRASEAQAWVTERGTVLAPSTLQGLVIFVRGLFRAAVRDKLIASNPFEDVKSAPVARRRVVPLTIEQVGAIVDHAPPHHQAMIITQAGLGLRISELLALREQDVVFDLPKYNREPRTVYVEHQVDPNTRELVDPKTPRSRRSIPMPQVVADALSEHIRRFPPSADGLLFHTTSTARPIGQNYYRDKILTLAATRAKLLVKVTSHDLRHHYASVLLAAGESVVAVAERLGHDDASLVLSTYGHLLPNRDDHTRRAVDAAWAALDATGEAVAVTAPGRPR